MRKSFAIAVSLSTLFFYGCGGGGSSQSADKNTTSSVVENKYDKNTTSSVVENKYDMWEYLAQKENNTKEKDFIEFYKNSNLTTNWTYIAKKDGKSITVAKCLQGSCPNYSYKDFFTLNDTNITKKVSYNLGAGASKPINLKLENDRYQIKGKSKFEGCNFIRHFDKYYAKNPLNEDRVFPFDDVLKFECSSGNKYFSRYIGLVAIEEDGKLKEVYNKTVLPF